MTSRKLREVSLDTVIAKPAVASVPMPVVPKVGKLRATKLVSAAVMAEVRTEVNDFAAGVAETCKQLGEILANNDALMLQMPNVLEVECDIAGGVLGTTEGPTRNVLSLAVAETMFANFPPTTVGLNHFANTALKMKFLRPYAGKEYYIELPVGDEPDLVRARLSSDVPNAIGLLRRVDRVSLNLIEASEQQRKDRRVEMKKLAPTFLAVINAGRGETACEVHDRKQVVGYIRVSVLDGIVTATDAIGDDFVTELVGTAIPLAELDRGWFEQRSLKGAGDADVKLMAGLRRHLRNALTLARARVAWQAKKAVAKANAPAEPVAAPAPAPVTALKLVTTPAPTAKPINAKTAARKARKLKQRAAKAAETDAATPVAPEAPAVTDASSEITDSATAAETK